MFMPLPPDAPVLPPAASAFDIGGILALVVSVLFADGVLGGFLIRILCVNGEHVTQETNETDPDTKLVAATASLERCIRVQRHAISRPQRFPVDNSLEDFSKFPRAPPLPPYEFVCCLPIDQAEAAAPAVRERKEACNSIDSVNTVKYAHPPGLDPFALICSWNESILPHAL